MFAIGALAVFRFLFRVGDVLFLLLFFIYFYTCVTPIALTQKKQFISSVIHVMLSYMIVIALPLFACVCSGRYKTMDASAKAGQKSRLAIALTALYSLMTRTNRGEYTTLIYTLASRYSSFNIFVACITIFGCISLCPVNTTHLGVFFCSI